MKCPVCGNENLEGVRHCDSCGSLLAGHRLHWHVIGRDPSCGLVLPTNETRVSRRHARIAALGGGRFRIGDLGSANGIQVNGRTVQEEDIGLEDVVTFGSYRLEPAAFAHLDGPGTQAPGARWHEVGRDPSCALVVPLAAAGVSRRHARFRAVPGGVEIEDLGSPNGLFLNGRRIQRGVAGVEDEIRLGSWPLDHGLLAAVAGIPDVEAHRPELERQPPVLPPARPPASSRVGWYLLAVLVLVAGAAGSWLLASAPHRGLAVATAPPPEEITPTEALARMDGAVAPAGLARRLEIYRGLDEALDPLDQWVEASEEAGALWTRARNLQVAGVRAWDLLAAAYPDARLLEGAMSMLDDATRRARSVREKVRTLPQEVDGYLAQRKDADQTRTPEAVRQLAGQARSAGRAADQLRAEVATLDGKFKEIGAACLSAEQDLRGLCDTPGVGAFAGALADAAGGLAGHALAASTRLEALSELLARDASAFSKAGGIPEGVVLVPEH